MFTSKVRGFPFSYVCANMGLLKETISSFDFYFDQFVREKWNITLSITQEIELQKYIYCPFAIPCWELPFHEAFYFCFIVFILFLRENHSVILPNGS